MLDGVIFGVGIGVGGGVGEGFSVGVGVGCWVIGGNVTGGLRVLSST